MTSEQIKKAIDYMRSKRPTSKVLMLGERNSEIGVYDDKIHVWINGTMHTFKANTQPSVQRTRMANLVPNVIFSYTTGIHGLSKPPSRRYEAFVQAGDVTVSRYKVGIDTGRFGINIHRGGVNGTSSLGCQTIPPSLWLEFKNLVYNALDKFDQSVFPYMVVTKETVERLQISQPIKQNTVKSVGFTYYAKIKGKLVQLTTKSVANYGYTPARETAAILLGVEPEHVPFVISEDSDVDDEDFLKLNGVSLELIDVKPSVTWCSIASIAEACGYNISIEGKTVTLEKAV